MKIFCNVIFITFYFTGQYKIFFFERFRLIRIRYFVYIVLLLVFCPLTPVIISILGVGKQSDIPVINFKSESFKVETKRTINCAASNVTRTNWTVYGGDFYNVTVDVADIASANLILSVKKRVIDYGEYRICSTTFMTVDERFKATICGYLEVVATSLEAIISGGDEVNTAAEIDVCI